MLVRRIFGIAMLLLCTGSFVGCAVDSNAEAESAPTLTPTEQVQLADQEGKRAEICASIAKQLRSSSIETQPDGLFPYPGGGNQEYTSPAGGSSSDIEYQRLKTMQKRYRCFY